MEKRGFIREGYWADLVLVEECTPWQVSKEGLHYKCGWSPLEGTSFQHRIAATIVSGHLAYQNGVFYEQKMGERLMFNRP
jgi:dihydroorotase